MLVILLVIVIALAGLFLYAASQPDNFTVSRTLNINAAPEKIFPFLNDFTMWGRWSPYEKMDPAMRRTIAGASSGVGATYAWAGNGKVGAGDMLITASTPSSLVALDLNMRKPMRASNKVTFNLVANGVGADVTGAMHGSSPFIAKLMGVVMNMDKMVGKQFEEGLANLKRLAEDAT
jgi:Polyketide cyclase / dehydrase and lipid transport